MGKEIKLPKNQNHEETYTRLDGSMYILSSTEYRRKWIGYKVEEGKLIKIHESDTHFKLEDIVGGRCID